MGGFPIASVIALNRKGILAVGSQRMPQSHNTQQSSHNRLIGRDTSGCSGEKKQGAEQETGLIEFQGWDGVRIGEISSQAQALVAFGA